MGESSTPPEDGLALNQCCNEVELFISEGCVRCRSCDSLAASGFDTIASAIVGEAQHDIQALGYRRSTKERYQSQSSAVSYLSRYRVPRTPADLYAWYVAVRERRTVTRCLRPRVDGIDTVLDIPAGTGKLASVHGRIGYRTVAADVSMEMMVEGISHGQWKSCDVLGFVRGDIMKLRFEDNAVDCAVCLRLMHRLPKQLVVRALGELRRVARYFVVVSTRVTSFSVAGVFHRGEAGRARFDRASWTNLLENYGTVEDQYMISPFVSTEIVTVVRLD